MHPLLLLTAASFLALLFGIAANLLARSREPTALERDAGHGIAGLKRLVEAGSWRLALPALLITGGLLGVMVFGALALAVVFGQTATGVLMLLVALVAIAKIARDYARA
ncbi:MAG: hypothetical protein AB1689_01655 [Thermodesulfobacteriota bacterium]